MGVDERALGKRLQDARREAGLTQQELCQKAALSYSTLAKIERGAIKSPSVFTVAAIAAATNSSLEELLNIPSSGTTTSTKQISKTGVKFVYFDLNGTLVHSYERAFPLIAAEAGVPIDSVEAIYWRYDDQVCSGAMSLADFNAAMSEKLGLASFDWTKYYLEATEPVKGMAALVDWAADHYQVGLLTGSMPGHVNALGKAGKIPLDKFSVVVDSSQVKMIKDGPAIYQYAQDQAGVPPENILIIDDDKLSIVNADKLGWQISRFDTYDPAGSIAKIKAHLEF